MVKILCERRDWTGCKLAASEKLPSSFRSAKGALEYSLGQAQRSPRDKIKKRQSAEGAAGTFLSCAPSALERTVSISFLGLRSAPPEAMVLHAFGV